MLFRLYSKLHRRPKLKIVRSIIRSTISVLTRNLLNIFLIFLLVCNETKINVLHLNLTDKHTCMHVYINMCVRMYVRACMHTYIVVRPCLDKRSIMCEFAHRPLLEMSAEVDHALLSS